MVIITKGTIQRFASKHPTAKVALNKWYIEAKGANWSSYNEVKKTFNSVDAIGNHRYVFNIAGNNFRLIALIMFNVRTIFIRAILTHQEYDVHTKQKTLNTL